MNNDTQPDALRLADALQTTRADMIGTNDEQHYSDCQQAAAELRRLHAENLRLQMLCDTDKASADHWRAECEKLREEQGQNVNVLRQAQGGEAVACQTCRGSEFIGYKRGVRCATCNGTGYTSQPLQADAALIANVSGLKGLSNHVRAIDAYKNLVGDMDWVDKAARHLERLAVAAPLQADACKVPQKLIEEAIDYIDRVPDDMLNAEHIDRDKLIANLSALISASPAAPTQDSKT